MTFRPLNPFRPFEPFRYGVRSITAAIRALFAAGEQGWWYDPSDLSTLYQDSAGTTPVTAMEQFVGLILDKSGGGNHAFQTTLTKRMRVSRRVNLLVGTAALATQSITTVAGAHTFKFSGAGSVTLSGTATGTYSAGTHSITCTAGTLTVTVTGAVTDASLVPTIKVHLPYQWVNSSTDYDDNPAKFPTYLKPDGIDDCYITNDIDLTGTDKINVWAGITKLSDAAAAMVLEFSNDATGQIGAFSLRAPSAASTNAQFISKGTAAFVPVIAAPLAAPINTILGGVGDISGDIAAILVNGVEVARSTADQGTGNYGKHPLFIGARNQTALFFNGEIYSLIGRGALSNASQMAAVNQYIKQKMMLP